jgi:hypothetical protein
LLLTPFPDDLRTRLIGFRGHLTGHNLIPQSSLQLFRQGEAAPAFDATNNHLDLPVLIEAAAKAFQGF